MGKVRKKVTAIVLATIIITGVCQISTNASTAVNHQYDLVELSSNLIQNGSFENNGEGWKTTGTGKFITDGIPASGTYCGLLPSESNNASVYQVVNVKPNTEYIAKAKVLVGKDGGVALFNVKDEEVTTLINNAEVAVNYNSKYDWKYQDVELKFNSGDNTKVSLCVMKWTEAQSGAIYNSQVYVDDVFLQEVNAETIDDYNMVWADDFNETKLDESDWGYELGSIRGVEQQHYTMEDDNVYVKDGKLTLQITNRNKEDQYKNPRGERQVIYDSGSVRTHGKEEFLYGRIEIKAKLPKGQGVFPAFWTLGSDFTLDGKINGAQGQPWPVCGEIDIMELTGKASDTAWGGNQTVWQTLHYDSVGGSDTGKYAGNGTAYALSEGIFNDDYHVFGLNWSPGKMEWYVDDQIVRTVDYSDDPVALLTLDRPQYIQLNLAAGGNWPGDAGTNLAGQKFEIDYVYYARNAEQQAAADEYYSKAAKIEGVKDVITMTEGEIPDLLEGVTSTNDTTVDFSVENEYMFTNVGGMTAVNLVCTGKADAAKLATLPAGKYNIHYSAIPNDEELRNNPYTRKSSILIVEKATTTNAN